MEQAIALSYQSPVQDKRYRVGAIIVDERTQGILSTGFTGETIPIAHAEEVAFGKIAAKDRPALRQSILYSTMEPCSQRASAPKSCTQIIIESGIKKVAYGFYEPDHFVLCDGAALLKKAGIDLIYIPNYVDEIRKINAHIGYLK
jgi:pyrimidine deaminase RibD-like protein